jgi:25S rRNA (cytosine2278-C5)-methyltransferase
MEALKEYVESVEGESANPRLTHPRWIRINTIKTQLEDELETTFSTFERAMTVNAVRERGTQQIYIDEHVPNLVAIPATIDLTKSQAYTSGTIIFQDKASCFPAYMLDPLPEDGDIVDTCAAPGNKTSHIAAILSYRTPDLEYGIQKIYAFEKDKARAETLKNMTSLAGCQDFVEIRAGQDFLRVDPNSPTWKNVGALLLDPSCSGSGIIGREDIPELHLPSIEPTSAQTPYRGRTGQLKKRASKRKRSKEQEDEERGEEGWDEEAANDPIKITPTTTLDSFQARLSALSAFQLSLLLHAFSFPSAHKVTYSTCSIHAAENEDVVLKALASPLAQTRGWRLLRRDEQVRGLREWPVRGLKEACGGADDIANACIRANKDDEHGTMGFFLVGFVREKKARRDDDVLRDAKGFIVRDLMGFPVRITEGTDDESAKYKDANLGSQGKETGSEEWNGFSDDEGGILGTAQAQEQGLEQEKDQDQDLEPELEQQEQAPEQVLEAENRLSPAQSKRSQVSLGKRRSAKKRKRKAAKR